jgi:hypothetical protein
MTRSPRARLFGVAALALADRHPGSIIAVQIRHGQSRHSVLVELGQTPPAAEV